MTETSKNAVSTGVKSRRSFLKGAGLAAGGVAVAELAAPSIARAETRVIKMQSA